MKQRYFIELSFRGTNYSGWQIQKNGNSVQAEVNHALSTILQEEIKTMGAGRTDKGVHAEKYIAHFDTSKTVIKNHIFKLNQFLPKDIAVREIYFSESTIHARFDAISRSYKYCISHKKNPFGDGMSFLNWTNYDIKKMNTAAALLLKHKEFQSFSKSKSDLHHFQCKISYAKWKKEGSMDVFYITSNRFLRGMVRAITGTLIKVGNNKLKINDFNNIILSKNIINAGPLVPAHGLFFTGVEYPFNLTPIR